MIELLKRDIAQVTQRGILYAGYFYSCRRAILEQWFYTAACYDEWQVDINYSSQDISNITLAKYNGEVCRLIKIEAYDEEQTRQYHDMIEVIKKSRRRFERDQGVVRNKNFKKSWDLE